MSEKEIEPDTDSTAQTDDALTERDSDDTTQATDDAVFAEQAAPSRGRSGTAIALLALLVSGVALVGSAYVWISSGDEEPADDSSRADIQALQSAVRTSRESIATLEQSISALSTLDGTRSAEMAALDRQLEQRLRQLEALPGRIAGVEGTLSTLQGVSTGARDAWLLAEAEYYMQIANAQLQLAGNPHLATLALTLADERLLQLANPGLVQVRRALSEELRELEAMEKPDTEGITLTLASLSGAVDSLPLRNEDLTTPATSEGIDPELTGVDRAMASLSNTFAKVVTVRRTDEVVQPMIAPEAQYFLRANLALQFQAARLAMLRNEEIVFSQSLDDAAEWLHKYYDTGNPGVTSALTTIAEIRDNTFSVAVPDISQSLRLLRQFNALTELAADQPLTDDPVVDEDMGGESSIDNVAGDETATDDTGQEQQQ